MRSQSLSNQLGRAFGILLTLLDSQGDAAPKPSHTDIAASFAPDIDKIIIDGVKNEKLHFVGGKFYFELLPNEESFGINMELYFQNAGEWVCKSWTSDKLPLSILLLDSRTKLKRDRKIEYEVTNPLEK